MLKPRRNRTDSQPGDGPDDREDPASPQAQGPADDMPAVETPVSSGRRVGRRRRRLAAVSTIVSAAIAVGVLVADHPRQQTITLRAPTLPAASGAAGPAPGFRLADLRHPATTITLSEYRGRPVIVNFWASWCFPCRAEMPAFAGVARQLSHQAVFVGVDEEDSRSSALSFAAAAGVGYPLVSDPQGSLTSRFKVVGFPTTVIISADGRIAADHPGPLSAKDLRSLLAPALRAGQRP